MSETEIIIDGGRRQRWPVAGNLRIMEQPPYGGQSIFAIALRNGMALNLLFYRCNRCSKGAVPLPPKP
ncbi:hypothetical protein DS906_15890 [Ruegeria sp. A3M17]|nr:hypothetical protein DS906_15890 [Ruegeria sp. A3M17]